MKAEVPVTAIHWTPAWRVIPTRYPEINLWTRVTRPGDEAAVEEIEQLTNNRQREERGEMAVLRSEDAFSPGCPIDVKASFVYRGTQSRFSTTLFGAFYAAASLKTAVCEKAHRTIRLLKEAGIPATRAEMRVIKAEINVRAHDIRGKQKSLAHLYDKSNYTSSQSWASELWTNGSQGVVYDSVRDVSGECIAIFSPQTISHCRKDRVLTFEWNGLDTVHVGEVREYLSFPEL